MKKAIEKLGLHLTLLLHKAGADDQAYDEILDSLERARERTKTSPPFSPQNRAVETKSIELSVTGA